MSNTKLAGISYTSLGLIEKACANEYTTKREEVSESGDPPLIARLILRFFPHPPV